MSSNICASSDECAGYTQFMCRRSYHALCPDDDAFVCECFTRCLGQFCSLSWQFFTFWVFGLMEVIFR
jgi:hypothetical protein